MAEFILYVVEAGLLTWFVSRFGKKEKFNAVLFCVFGTVYALVKVAGCFFSEELILPSILAFFILTIYSVLVGCRKWGLLVPFISVGTVLLFDYLSFSLYSFLLRRPFSEVMERSNETRAVALYSALVIVLFVLINIVEFTVEKRRKFQEYFILIISPVLLFGILLMTLIFASFAPMNNYRILFILACLFALMIYGGIYYLVYKVTKNLKSEAEKQLYKQMLDYEERRYEDIHEATKRIGKIKHDIKNELNVVAPQLEQKEYGEAQESLNRLLQNVNTTGTIVSNGNDVSDYIINTKLGNLKNTVIIVSGDSNILNFIDKLDVSIILGCIIDNAVEAIKKVEKPYVELCFFEKNNHANIVCKNSVLNSVLAKNPALETTKKDKNQHGFGMRSIEEVTLKYNGMLSTYEEDDLFCIHILLPEYN